LTQKFEFSHSLRYVAGDLRYVSMEELVLLFSDNNRNEFYNLLKTQVRSWFLDFQKIFLPDHATRGEDSVKIVSNSNNIFLSTNESRKNLFIHVITDGRDCSPSAGLGFIEQLEDKIRGTNTRIASVMGRYWAMDRDNRWERVAVAYETMTGIQTTHKLQKEAPGVQQSFRASTIVSDYYAHPTSESQLGDEFVLPTQIVDEGGKPIGLVQDGDSVLFFNYRGDRPRELSKAFVLSDDAWAGVPRGPFERGNRLRGLYFATMTNYESDLPVSAVACDKPKPMKNI